MGHFGFAAVRKILGMPASKDNPICHSCEITRATQSAMQQESNQPRAGAVLRRMWMDIGFGRMSNLVFQAYKDDHSRRIWVHKLKDKSETLTAFIPLQRQLENEVHPRKLGAVARDNDRCYTGQNWKVYAAEHGIELEFYGPHRKETPMERAMQSLGGPARAYMHHGNAPETNMFYAIEHQAFCLNYRPHKGNPDDRSPMSMWQGVKLKRTERMTKGVMFCLAYGFIYPEERAKNDNRSFPAIFLGCHHSERSYRLRCLNSGKIYWVCDVKFVCNIMPYRQNMPGRISHHDPNYVDLEPDEFDEHGTTDDRLAAREHLGRVREMSGAALQKFSTFTACTAANDPTTWDEAMAGPDAAEWREAAAIEDANHKANGTWIMVDRSEAIGHKIFWPKLVLKTKMLPPCLEYPNGKIDKRKVRKTIQAFKATLRNGVDYRESYAATPQWNSIRMIFAVACYFDLDLTLKDIVAYFLAAYLEAGEDIFMEQEPRTDDGTGRLCKLIKSMYGLPQAAYHAQRKLMAALAKDGLHQTVSDRAVVVKKSSNVKAQHAEVICSIHVDDTLSTGTTGGLAAVSESLKKAFKITSDPDPKLVIGVQIERCRPHRWLKIHQYGYVVRLLTAEGMLDSKKSSTPINKGLTKQTSYNDGKPDTREDLHARKRFQEIFGQLMWLSEKTRKDLRFTVNFFGRMLTYAKEYHLGLIRGQPLRYLNGTRDYGLVYQAGEYLKLHGAADADFAGDCVKMRSTIGTYGALGDYGLIWDTCSLVKTIQTSTGHSETTAAASWVKEQKSARIQLREYGLAEQERVVCRVDNAGVVKQAVNTTNHSQAKHYRVNQAYIREACDTEQVLLVQIASEDNPADFFTKALDKGPFEHHRHTIMGPQDNPGKAKANVARAQ